MKKNLLVYISILFSCSIFASNTVDSLLNALTKLNEHSIDAAYINLRLSHEYLHSDPDKSLQYAQKAVEISRNSTDTIAIIKALKLEGLIHSDKGDLQKAISLYIESLELAEKIENRVLQAQILNAFSDIYRKQRNFDKTLESSFKVLRIYEELKDSVGIGDTYNNIAIAYYWIQDIPKATTYFEKAVEIRKMVGNKTQIAGAMENLASIYVVNKEFDKALEICFSTLKIEKEINDKLMMASTLGNIGTIYLDVKEFEKAKEFQSKSVEMALEINSKPLIRNGYNNLHRIHEQLGEFQEALRYHKLYTQYQDSILNDKNQEQILEMEAKYENHKKELEIDNLQKENALKDAEVKKQNLQKVVFAAGFLFVLVIVIIIYKGYKQKEKSNLLLAQQKTQIENAYSILDEKNTEITNSIKYAKRIQNAILPSLNDFDKHLNDSFIFFKPKDVVSGDFYWFETIGNKVFVAAADCTGHGVPGAMVSVTCANALSKALLEEEVMDTGKLLDRTRELVIKRFQKSKNDLSDGELGVKDGMDIALCCIEYTEDGCSISFSGANNPLYILRSNSKDIEIIKGDRQPIGDFDKITPFTSHQITLQKGDIIYLFTDGYADQFGGNQGKKIGYSQFRSQLIANSTLSMDEQKNNLYQFFNEWMKNEVQLDDVCIIGIKI